MSIVYYIIQILCSIWVIFFVPFILITWIRCIVHNLSYSAGLNDLMTAISVIALYMLGLPKFPGI